MDSFPPKTQAPWNISSEDTMNGSVPNNITPREEHVQNLTDAVENVFVLNGLINIPLALTSIVGNTLVLHGVWKTPSLRSPSIIFICGLALSDLAVGAVVQPLFIANNFLQLYSRSQRLKDVFLSIYNTFGYTFCGISLCTVAVISLDRLIAIKKSLQYASLVTIPRVTRILVSIWTICALLPALQFCNVYIRVIAIGTVTCVCLCISTISHIIIYKNVLHHQHAIQMQVQAVEANNGVLNNVAGLKRSALNSFIVFLVLFICYCPYFVIYAISSPYTIDGFLARGLTSTIVFINSLLNPFLYCWRLRGMREAVKQSSRKLFLM